MAAPDREKADGLEMISIGALYRGQWDKKYWSSSRGKDRYPYPIGYHAVRTHAGSTYRMEIHKGLKGPLFVISSMDGDSCSGLTPDIAWEYFQRGGCPRVKTIHGKRLSCKIDGTELFGFRNPFVQRLLRELVANVNGMAEYSFVSPNFCDEVSGLEHEVQLAGEFGHPPSLSSFGKLNNTRKVCGNGIYKRRKSYGGTTPLRDRTEFGSYEANVDIVRKENESGCIGHISSTLCVQPLQLEATGRSKTSSPAGEDLHTNQQCIIPSTSEVQYDLLDVETMSVPVDLDASNRECSNAKDSLPSELPRVTMPSMEKPVFSKNQEELDKLSDGAQDDDSARATNDGDARAPVLPAPKHMNGFESHAPHSFDLVQGRTHVDSEWQTTVSNVDDGIGSSGTINENSEKSDYDSTEPELATSMINVLLPRALPLLKKTYKRKRARTRISKKSSSNFDQSEASLENINNHHDSCTKSLVITNGSILCPVQNDTCGSDYQLMDCIDGVPANDHDGIVADSIMDVPFCESSPPEAKLVISDGLGDAAHDANANGHLHSSFDRSNLSISNNSGCKVTSKWQHRIETLEPFNDEVNLSGDAQVEYADNFSPNGCFFSSEDTFFNEELKLALDHIEGKGNLEEDPYLSHSQCVKTDIRQASFAQCQVLLDCAKEKLQCSHPQDEDTKPINFDPSIAKDEEAANVKDERSFFVEKAGPDTTLSESIICRNIDGHGAKNIYSANGNVHQTEVEQFNVDGTEIHHEMHLTREPKLAERRRSVNTSQADHEPEGLMGQISDNAPHDASGCVSTKPGTKVSEKGLESIVRLVGHYVHPAPILSIILSTKLINAIHVCVLCGFSTGNDGTLFIYRIPTEDSGGKSPYFRGYTSIITGISERSAIEFTPDARHLVLLDSVKMPCCRERNINCLCSTCTSDICEANALKVVTVELGYVSLLSKLRSVGSVTSLLVCGPNYLVAVEESGKLHAWVMNTTWSASIEEFNLPSLDYAPSSVSGLKRIPHSASLVVGHSDIGTFGLWNIGQRSLVARFSAPGSSVYQVVPVSFFSWQESMTSFNSENHIKKVVDATKMSFYGDCEGCSIPPCEDTSMWLLISAASEDDVNTSLSGLWRFALMRKSMVLMGDILDLRALAVGVLGDQGVIGTCDGLVYLWDLATGRKLANLHHFEGGSVSRVAVDANSSSLAVASGHELLVFAESSKMKATHHQPS